MQGDDVGALGGVGAGQADVGADEGIQLRGEILQLCGGEPEGVPGEQGGVAPLLGLVVALSDGPVREGGLVVDLAIGVIIGAAFGKIVESMVGDIIMPIISLPGSVDFTNMYLVLKGAVAPGTSLVEAKKQAVVLGWGNFVTLAINFIIVAFALFWVVKMMNRLKREEAKPAAPAGPTAEEKLLTEIRDLLKR